MSDDWVRISSGALSAAINSIGAELSSLTDTGGNEWMTDADPAYWSGRSPLLFPIVGALSNGHYRLDGKDYPMPQHGFARRMRFALIERAADHLCLRLTESRETLAIYPFTFTLDADYRVKGNALTMAITVTNTGYIDLPASFGFHPAFAWPLPGEDAKEAHSIRFETPEPGALARLAGGLIDGYDRASPLVDAERLPLTDALFDADALIWDGLVSRSVTYQAGNGPSLRVDFPDADKLGIWTRPGAQFLCIEPWWGIADPVGFKGDIWDKPGMLRLTPGESRVFAMRIAITG